MKAGRGEPYLAPLDTDPAGPHYLWGGIDPIAVIEVRESKIFTAVVTIGIATEKRWEYAAQASLLRQADPGEWERKRQGMPVIQVN